MNNRALALIGGAAGAAVAYLALRLPPPKVHEIKIVVRRDGHRCKTETRPQHFKASKLDVITWKVVGNLGCLGDGCVELRFEDGTGPLLEPRPSGKSVILDLVIKGQPAVYEYKVWFVGKDGTEYEMEDPKIEIVQI